MKTTHLISLKWLLLVVLFCYKTVAYSQAPAIEWQKCLGGSGHDRASSIQQTSDGGYIAACTSGSIDGDLIGNGGVWIMKLDGNGNIIWQKNPGGSGGEGANAIQQTSDGGYIVACVSSSTDGDVTGNHGMWDYWIVKLDVNGNLTWQKSLGGSLDETASSIQQTSDGGYIVAGYSKSTDGDVTGHHGSSNNDYWIAKLDSIGNIMWQKSLGGSLDDWANSIQQTIEGGYIVAGFSYSIDGDITGHHGTTSSADYWIVKLDSSGNITWQKSLGGSSNEQAYSIQQTLEGEYIVAGKSYSNNGDVTGHHSNDDYWIVKLDAAGNIVWQKSLGGSSDEEAYSIQQTSDAGYIVAGYSNSNSDDVTGNHGFTWSFSDAWIVKLDSSGNLIWQKCLGGGLDEIAYSIRETSGGGYIMAGKSTSDDGDLSVNKGDWDFWIVKLAGTTDIDSPLPAQAFSLYPNPNTGDFLLKGISEDLYPLSLSVSDISGKKIHQQSYSDGGDAIPLHLVLPQGIYFLAIQSEKGTAYQKFRVE